MPALAEIMVLASCNQSISAASILVAFLVGVATGWLLATGLALPARQPSQTSGPETTNQTTTSQTSAPETTSQTTTRRRRHSGNRRFEIRKQPRDADCSHTGLQVSTRNQWAWSVQCPQCQLAMSVWWQGSQDHSMHNSQLVDISKNLAMHRQD